MRIALVAYSEVMIKGYHGGGQGDNSILKNFTHWEPDCKLPLTLVLIYIYMEYKARDCLPDALDTIKIGRRKHYWYKESSSNKH